MASRKEEKEARRQARIEQEEAERRAAARRRKLQLVGAVAAAAIVIAAVVVAIAASGGNKQSASGNKPTQVKANGVKLPAVQEADLTKAAKAAGCTLSNPRDVGRSHENRTFTAADYKSDPPTSGTHFPQPAQDGEYTQQTVPQVGALMHALEHSRINVQYKPGTDAATIKKLEALLAEADGGYHMLLYPNTGMKSQVAATAWDHAILCPTTNDKIYDALRDFRERYIDKGPEVPQ